MPRITRCYMNDIPIDPLASEIVREQEAAHQAELKRLDDLAFALLFAVAGCQVQAEKLLDDFVDLLCENGTLLMWRYRILLAKVREGL